jgi:hypothetical protein
VIQGGAPSEAMLNDAAGVRPIGDITISDVAADNLDEPSGVLNSDPNGSLLERGKGGLPLAIFRRIARVEMVLNGSAVETPMYNGPPLSKLGSGGPEGPVSL